MDKCFFCKNPGSVRFSCKHRFCERCAHVQFKTSRIHSNTQLFRCGRCFKEVANKFARAPGAERWSFSSCFCVFDTKLLLSLFRKRKRDDVPASQDAQKARVVQTHCFAGIVQTSQRVEDMEISVEVMKIRKTQANDLKCLLDHTQYANHTYVDSNRNLEAKIIEISGVHPWITANCQYCSKQRQFAEKSNSLQEYDALIEKLSHALDEELADRQILLADQKHLMVRLKTACLRRGIDPETVDLGCRFV